MNLFKNKKLCILGSIYLTIELALLVLILFVVTGPVTNYLQYSAIALSFIFALVFFDKKYLLIYIGMLLTLCADFFLVLRICFNQIAGMVFFSLAQMAYFVYLLVSTKDKKLTTWNIACHGGLLVVTFIAAFLIMQSSFDALVAITVIYFTTFIANIVFAFIICRENKIFPIGLVLFIMCDVFVGLVSGIEGGYFPIGMDSGFYEFLCVFNFSWLFYLPSQVVIAISTVKEKLH